MKVCTTCGAEWPDDTKFCPSDGSALRSADGETSLVGGVLQSYHIIKKLGEGGMGAVYLGEHVKMGRKSAIKVMTQSLANDTDAIARFNREAANAASINHVNVCAIYDFGETADGTIFLAMEYIEGEALTDLIKREGPLDLKRAGAILKQTGEALQAAHELGIVHRDLKPDNIMIAKARDGSDLVKVVDFGIAKAMGGEEGQNVTRTGLVVGTPEYMSPEQLSGDKLDGRSDVYSLALVFFRMITGTLPFRADSAQEVMIKRLTDEPARLNEALPGASFPPKLQLVMDRAMERMPSDRYAAAGEFAGEAVTAVADSPAATSPPSFDSQAATQLLDTGPSDPEVTEALKKTRLSEAPATISLGELADGEDVAEAPTVAPSEDVPDRHTPDTPKPPPGSGRESQKKKMPVMAIVGAVAVIGVGGGAAAIAFGGGGDSNVSNDSTQMSLGMPTDSGTGDDTTAGGAAGTNPGVEQEQPDPEANQGTEQETTADSSAVSIEDPVVPPPPTIDSAAIDNELFEMDEGLEDDGLRPALMERAQSLYNDTNIPAPLRGQAAYMVAMGYTWEDEVGDACRWLSIALSVDPGNQRYIDALEGARCNL